MLFLQSLYFTIRALMSPFLVVIVQMIPSLKKRKDFESLNQQVNAPLFRSFKEDGVQAQHCYHVSSEGEWEQVWPFVLDDIKQQKPVEILYTSESLEKRIQALKANFDSSQIRFFRMPLLQPKLLFEWVSAKSLILCRYDFFPELFFLGEQCRQNAGRFILLSASFKSRKDLLKREGTLLFLIWQWVYRRFDLICVASSAEKERFLKLGVRLEKLWTYDARGLQICLRLKKANGTLEHKNLTAFCQLLLQRDPSLRLMMGSAWPEDLDILRQRSKIQENGIEVFIAPHKLDQLSLERLQLSLEQMQYKVFFFGADTSVHELKKAIDQKFVIILTLKGLLLELYTLFSHVYVGGGFGRSVHSVLEPYLARAQVYCGPKTHRSSEVERIMGEREERIAVIEDADEWIQAYIQMKPKLNFASSQQSDYYEELYNREIQDFHAARDFLFH